MGVELGPEEPLRENLIERFLRGKAHVVHSFRSIKTKTAALATSKDDNADFAFTDELVACTRVCGLVLRTKAGPIDHSFRLNCIEG